MGCSVFCDCGAVTVLKSRRRRGSWGNGGIMETDKRDIYGQNIISAACLSYLLSASCRAAAAAAAAGEVSAVDK